jgi:hypothetical protein
MFTTQHKSWKSTHSLSLFKGESRENVGVVHMYVCMYIHSTYIQTYIHTYKYYQVEYTESYTVVLCIYRYLVPTAHLYETEVDLISYTCIFCCFLIYGWTEDTISPISPLSFPSHFGSWEPIELHPSAIAFPRSYMQVSRKGHQKHGKRLLDPVLVKIWS